MDPPLPAVVVCEENRTRADLYRHWLDTYRVRVAPTMGRADEALEDDVGVGIVDQSFGDDDAETVVQALRSRSPMARVVATRERSAVFPELNVDHQFVKPVFEDELVEKVDTLIHRANFHVAVKTHYRVAIALTSYRLNGEESDVDDDQYERLEARADELKTLIGALADGMDDEDVDAVRRAITFEESVEAVEERASFDSKYLPPKCSGCGADWTGVGADGEDPVAKLGAHVWRCRSCGKVHMQARAGNNQFSYQR